MGCYPFLHLGRSAPAPGDYIINSRAVHVPGVGKLCLGAMPSRIDKFFQGFPKNSPWPSMSLLLIKDLNNILF